MIVCSCNIISDKDIEEIVISLLEQDKWQLIVPGRVYKEMQKRGRCCGCFPNVIDIIIRLTETYHRQNNIDSSESIVLLERVRALKQKYQRIRHNERSRKGHRAA